MTVPFAEFSLQVLAYQSMYTYVAQYRSSFEINAVPFYTERSVPSVIISAKHGKKNEPARSDL